MAAPLDIDQLRTFIAIIDNGSFTRAAGEVNKTQSAVSMQMRRLEERLNRVLFEKDGRVNRLTGDGEKLLAYPRRMVRLNNETLAAFDEEALAGSVRLGTPDDYADRYMPISSPVSPNRTPMSNSASTANRRATWSTSCHATRSILHWSPIARRFGSRRSCAPSHCSG